MSSKKKIKILDPAQFDITRGFGFYEELEDGLGNYFLDTIFAEVETLTNYAGVHPVKFGCHCMYVRNFPYAIYYRVDGKDVLVDAVFDCRQNPDRIKKRLENDV